MSATSPGSTVCAFVVGDDGLASWSETHADAWIGLLETYKSLTRALDAELEAGHELSLSGLEVLGRLAAAEQQRLRLSVLAEASGLSLSRVSRLVDVLEGRGLLQRRSCPSDARSVEAQLTEAGLELARAGQQTHFASVQRRFFDHLSPAEIEVLASVFRRLSPRAASACRPRGTTQRD